MDDTNLSRRRQLQQWAGLVAAAGAGSLLGPRDAQAQLRADAGSSRRLVAYNSRTGHTRQAALVIAAAVGAGKTLAPFCTSAMSGLAGTEQTLRELCPRSRVLAGLALPGGGRGHNTLVTSIGADARRRAEQWGRQGLEQEQDDEHDDDDRDAAQDHARPARQRASAGRGPRLGAGIGR